MVWTAENSSGAESKKIIWETVPYTRGKGLDVGCGPMKLWPQSIGVDNDKDVSLFGSPPSEADIRTSADDLSVFASQSMDYVFSSHMLEHFEDYEKPLREMWRVVKQGGYLLLYLPHKDFYPNIGQEGANPDHCHDFTPNMIIESMKKIGGWDCVENQDRNEGDEYSFFIVFKKLSHKDRHTFSCNEPKPKKTCAIIRYGAWGDGIQASSILPGLKEQGYHITFYTTPRCQEVIAHEPLIDRFIVQDPEQVPNHWLGPFWDYLRKKYDKFINLSESVEATFLAMPDRMPYKWTQAARHMVMNGNYWEFMHKEAGVPYTRPQSRFVPTPEERAWAIAEKRKIAAGPTILWVLAGSSVHKVWEGVDGTFARILTTFPEAKIITVGDARCRDIIEAPWEKEARIVRRSGVWSIRQTMAFAQVCDLVVGPETGVMNAVCMEKMPKIVLLSHSSVNNLTRDWENTISCFSVETPCYPCHKLIYNWDQCVKHEDTGTAQCQKDISVDQVWNAICDVLGYSEAVKSAEIQVSEEKSLEYIELI